MKRKRDQNPWGVLFTVNSQYVVMIGPEFKGRFLRDGVLQLLAKPAVGRVALLGRGPDHVDGNRRQCNGEGQYLQLHGFGVLLSEPVGDGGNQVRAAANRQHAGKLGNPVRAPVRRCQPGALRI